jgi:predicted ATPase
LKFSEVENTIKEEIKKLKIISDEVYPYLIKSLIFPYFKNFENMTEISFEFPLTIFVGENGSGKSSALQALYGVESGKSLSEHWFSTELDPINERSDGITNRYYCRIKEPDGVERILYYNRIFHKRFQDPNYWETRIPPTVNKIRIGERYQLGKNKMKIEYINFRYLLSAYDVCMNFYNPDLVKVKAAEGRNAVNKLKEFIRYETAKNLQKIVNDEKEIIKSGRGSKEQNETIEFLKPEEIQEINSISGKKYSKIKILKHKFFGLWGQSIKVSSDNKEYTDANAGSGEANIINLVYRINRCKKNTLILLDEPEISIHPGAQRRLLLYLLRKIKTEKHQIVICTHSPEFIKSLPKEAIHCFCENVGTSRFSVRGDIPPEEAFLYIGESNENKSIIIVEDSCAKQVLDGVIENISDHFLKEYFEENFQVLFRGSAGVIKSKLIPVYLDVPNKGKTFFLLDGDQNTHECLSDIEREKIRHIKNSSSYVEDDANYIKEIVKKLTGVNYNTFNLNIDGHNRVDDFRRVKKIIDLIEYYESNVLFLPKDTPEELIFDSDIMKMLCDISINASLYDELKLLSEEKINQYKSNYKSVLHEIAKKLRLDDMYVNTTFVNGYCNNTAKSQEILDLLKLIKRKSEF